MADEKLSKATDSAKIFVDSVNDEIPAPSLVPMSARVTTEFIGRTLELNNVVRRVVRNCCLTLSLRYFLTLN